MNVTAILQAHGLSPSVPGLRKKVGTPQTLVQSHVPQVPCVPAEKSRPATKSTKAPLTVSADTRADLLALADHYGFDLAHVHRLHNLDVAACAGLDGPRLVTYLELLDDTATRWAGKVPSGHTAAILCRHCGPVYVHPSIAACLPVVAGWPRALGCSWCAIREAGSYVPHPRITCENCTRFQTDSINPATGVGQCSSGCGMHYPIQEHGCGDFRPE